MSGRSKALGSVALLVAVLFGASWLVAPWAEPVALGLMIGVGICTTTFASVYMLTRPWWETNIGRALLASALSLAALVDISLAYRWLGDDYFLRDAVRLTVFAGVLVGSIYKCVSLVFPERWRSTSSKRNRGTNRV